MRVDRTVERRRGQGEGAHARGRAGGAGRRQLGGRARGGGWGTSGKARCSSPWSALMWSQSRFCARGERQSGSSVVGCVSRHEVDRRRRGGRRAARMYRKRADKSIVLDLHLLGAVREDGADRYDIYRGPANTRAACVRERGVGPNCRTASEPHPLRALLADARQALAAELIYSPSLMSRADAGDAIASPRSTAPPAEHSRSGRLNDS